MPKWQIGRVFSRFDTDDGAALAEARYAAIERLAKLATEQGCDAVLVAGDVFDAQTEPNGLASIIWPWAIGTGQKKSMSGPGTAARPSRNGSVIMTQALC